MAITTRNYPLVASGISVDGDRDPCIKKHDNIIIDKNPCNISPLFKVRL